MSESPDRVPRPARVLVLGATSLIGDFLIARLAGTGVEVIALSRRAPRRALHPAQWLTADLGDARLPDHLPQVDAIVSLSPIWLLPTALPALARTGARRLVAVSSTSRLTKLDSPAAEERDVAQRLARGEAETIRLCDRAGVAWTLLQPTLIYAEGRDGNVSRLASLIRRFGFIPLAGSGQGRRQPVHADDLAWAIQAVLDLPTAYGRTYVLPGGETLSYRAMVERVFASLGRPAHILSAPPWLWTLALRLAGPFFPGATIAMGERMSRDLTFDAAAAQLDFGWSPRPFQPRFPTLSASEERVSDDAV